MNETIKTIMTRRSVRAYREDAVPEALIEQVIEAGRWAASGMNRQPVEIIAVTQRAMREQLSRINARIMGKPEEFDPFYGAPAVLVVLADKHVPTSLYDGSLAMGNMMLAAQSLGLGSCWIHRAKETFECEEGQAILHSMGLNGEYEGIGNCILGYAAQTPTQEKPRRQGNVHWVK